MKRIELTKLSLLNFKGARNVEINFHGNTTIAADNGVGKSTLFDAFVWLLFGKNAEDRKDFSIKTYDTNGEIIPRIPHEVSAVINVNGENISLRRCFNEKWTKRRGSATEEFTGHEEERFWNDVPCSLKDWNTKIAELIPEHTFKMVTNPRYFVSQKADIQRATLIKMAGSIKDQDIVAGDSKFIQLLQDLQGKTLDEYKRQISAKKNIVKAEIKGIPDRIDERKRDIADAIPEADANNKMAALKLRQENIEEMLTFRNKSIDEINARREQANKKINAIQAAINERERQIITEANKELLEAQKSAMEIQNAIDKGVTSVERAKFDLELNQKEKESFEQQIAELRKEYLAERMKKIEFNENDFVCPTCKRPFDVSDVELKQREMTENFNQQKVLRLNKINEKGVELKTRIKEREMSIKANLDSIKFGEEAIAKLRAKQKSVVPQSESNADVYMNVDAMLKQLKEQLEKAKEEYNEIPNTANDDEEEAKKKAAERKKAREKYTKEIKDAIVKGEFEIAQAGIDAMEDGADKQDVQLRLNYNKRLKEMERQEEEYKKANKELYGNADLTEDQKKVLQQMRTLADSELAIGFAQIKKGKDQKTQDELNKRLQMWKDFSEKQTAIVEEYAEKRRKIEESETMTKPQKKEQLDRLDQQQRNDTAILIAQMGITDENVAEELIGIITDAYELATEGAVETLQEQLLQVEQQLQAMLKGGITEKNEEQYRRLKAQQVSFTKAVSKAKNAQDQLNNSANNTGKNIKQRMDLAASSMATLNQAISDVRGEFGELFDETTNNALDMIQTTMDAGIGVLNTLQATGVATATALSTAEKASVILTVISAAVQLTMGLVKLLSSTSQSAKAKKMADEYAKAAEAYHKEWERLRHEHRNSVGTQYYDELFADINSLRKEKNDIEKEIRERRRAMNLAETKKSKEKRKAELEDAQAHLREVEQQIEDAERTYFENLLQSNSKDFAANMADQLVEGWESGMRDMTSIFDDAVNDMLRSVVKSQLRMKLEEVYKDAFDEMQKQFGDRAEFSQNDLDAIKDRVSAANEQAKALADYYRQWWDALELNTGDLSASVGAIQGMTQDTAEELNGRFTALQMSGASIDLKMDSVVAGIHSLIGTNSGMADSIALAVGIASDQLNVLEDIRNHTARLASMERSLNTITNQMSTLTGQ